MVKRIRKFAENIAYNDNTNLGADNLQDAVDEISTQLKALFDKIYPIGTIYMSSSNVNPGTLFGGTWTAWGQGRVPVGAGSNGTTNYSVETTGGAESRAHQHASATSGSTAITTDQMPSHKHGFIAEFGATANDSFNPVKGTYMQASGPNASTRAITYDIIRDSGGGKGHTHSIPASNSVSIDIRQPYIVCYMWKRIS